MEKVGQKELGYDAYVHDLLRFSKVLEQKKLSQGRLSAARAPYDQTALPNYSLNLNYASPLSPLRSRDVEALVDIFSHDQLTEIEADIHQYLLRLSPEPCWEVEPYDFLKGFI